MNLNSVSKNLSTDIIEKDGNYELVMNLPRFKKEDIKIELKNGYLKIYANSKIENQEKDKEGNCLYKEGRSETFSKSFYIGQHLKQKDIKAKFENATLTLTFPKIEEKQHFHKY